MLNPTINRRLHVLLSQLNLMEGKPAMVEAYTAGRTASSKEMTDAEALALITSLERERDDRSKKMRGKVLHYLALLGYTTASGDLDYARINRFIENIGARNPNKKKLLYLSPGELRNVLTQVEAIYKKETHKG